MVCYQNAPRLCSGSLTLLFLTRWIFQVGMGRTLAWNPRELLPVSVCNAGLDEPMAWLNIKWFYMFLLCSKVKGDWELSLTNHNVAYHLIWVMGKCGLCKPWFVHTVKRRTDHCQSAKESKPEISSGWGLGIPWFSLVLQLCAFCVPPHIELQQLSDNDVIR